ncbi:MAG TPA: VOC family protein [Chloroflexota bacterium]|nr:VOC family protein [Chloroflexota bacterium]
MTQPVAPPDNAPLTAPPPVASIHHISLTVTDLARSEAWYTELFGMTKIMDEPHHGGRAIVLMQVQAGLFIGLHAHDANQRENFAETRTGLDHVSFGVSSRPELEAWERRLAERHIVHSAIADASYGSVLVLRDSDNIQLEFIAPAQG